MDKTTLGLIAAVSAFAATPALASTAANVTEQIMNPRSVAELLEPIANPVETLAAIDADRQLEGVELAQADIQVGPLEFGIGHHHHHHNHYGYGHHHHHQQYYYRQRQRYHHHHHHHHHHHYNRYNNY